jgi:hypothetical protein
MDGLISYTEIKLLSNIPAFLSIILSCIVGFCMASILLIGAICAIDYLYLNITEHLKIAK